MKPKVVSADTVSTGRDARPPSVALKATSLVLGLGAVSVLAGVLTLTRSVEIAGSVVLVLLVLTVAATQRVAIFGDETAINSSMVVLSAAAATVAAGGPLWVPVVCGLAAGMHWDHVRHLAFRKLVVNTSCTTIAAFVAAALGRGALLVGVQAWIGVGIGAILAVVAYWLTNNLLIAAVLWAADGGSLRRYAQDLTRSETELLPFAILGFLSGYVVLQDLGTLAMVLALVGLLIVTDRVLVGRISTGRVWRASGALALVAGLLSAAGLCARVATTEAFPATLGVLLIVGLGVLGSLAVAYVRPSVGPLAPVMAGTALVFFPQSGHPALGPLVAMLASGLPLLVQPVGRGARVRLAASIVLGAIALVSATVFLPLSSWSSAVGALMVGSAAGFAALVGWHSCMFIGALQDRGPDWLVAFDLLRSDAFLFVGGGIAGALVGWIGLHGGVAYMAGALAAALVVVVSACMVRGRDLAARSGFELNQRDLVDVVQSAVLGLPGSRIPDH